MRKALFLSLFLICVFLLFAYSARAQTLDADQVIDSPYSGWVYATQQFAPLAASSTPFFASFFANLGSIVSLTLPSITDALLLTDSSGNAAEYTGTTCTNQFIRALSSVGLATCESVNLASDVTGILGLANGGTAGNDATSGFNNLAPTQAGNSGKFLTTDGTNTSWGTPAGGGGGVSPWATTTSTVAGQLINYPTNDTDIVSIGANATTTSEFFFDPNLAIGYVSGKLGIGTTSPAGKLTVWGSTEGLLRVGDASDGISLGKGSGFGLIDAYDTQASSYNDLYIRTGVTAGTGIAIKTTGNVGIGTTAPDNKLHVFAATAGTVTGTLPLVIENNTTSGLQVLNPDSAYGALYFGAPTSATAGRILYGGPSVATANDRNALILYTDNSEKMRISAAGNVGVGTTTPGSILSIGSSTKYINLSNTATSTFAFPVRSNCFTTDGTTCITGGGGSGITNLGPVGQYQTGTTQTFATSTTGTDFTITSSGDTHTFNIPSASATARGFVTSSSQTFGGSKTFQSPAIVSNTNGINSNSSAVLHLGRTDATSAFALIGGATGASSRLLFGFPTTAEIINTDYSFGTLLIPQILYQRPASGTNDLVAQIAVKPFYFNSSGGSTIGNTASIYISGAATTTVTGGNYALFVDDGTSRFDGGVGIGTTTPWATLSVGSTTYTNAAPLFAVSTSTDSFGQLFFIKGDKVQPDFGGIASAVSGARVIIGKLATSIHNLFINGTVASSWENLYCDSFKHSNAALSADTLGATICGFLTFDEGTTATFTAGTNGADQGGTLAVSSGAGVDYARLIGGSFRGDFLASTTPKMEIVVGALTNTSTTTSALIGWQVVGFADGCYITATSTANWQGVCDGATVSQFDTGLATSTAKAQIRLELGPSLFKVDYRTSPYGSYVNAGTLTSNIPSNSSSFTSMVSVNRAAGGLAVAPSMAVFGIRMFRQSPWNWFDSP